MKQNRWSLPAAGLALHSMTLPMLLAIAVTALSGSLPGCKATGEAFKPADQVPGTSLIYFYREENWAGSMFDQHIFLDGKEVAQLSPGGYYVISVSLGEHTASLQVPSGFSTKAIGVKMTTVADRSHYVRVGFALTQGAVVYNEYTTSIEVVEEELAISQLRRMKLQKQSIAQ